MCRGRKLQWLRIVEVGSLRSAMRVEGGQSGSVHLDPLWAIGLSVLAGWERSGCVDSRRLGGQRDHVPSIRRKKTDLGYLSVGR